MWYNSLRKQPFLLAAGKAKSEEKAAVFTGYTCAGSTFNYEVKRIREGLYVLKRLAQPKVYNSKGSPRLESWLQRFSKFFPLKRTSCVVLTQL